jgi:hypothetical protein
MTRCIPNLKSSHHIGWKIGVLCFFSPKIPFLTHFFSKTSRKYPKDLIKPSNDYQKANKLPKSPKST